MAVGRVGGGWRVGRARGVIGSYGIVERLLLSTERWEEGGNGWWRARAGNARQEGMVRQPGLAVAQPLSRGNNDEGAHEVGGRRWEILGSEKNKKTWKTPNWERTYSIKEEPK